jgi:hypothetical protein
VAASATLSRVAYELLGGPERALGLYRTAFIADDHFGLGRHPSHGLFRAREIFYSVSLELTRRHSVEY